MVAAAATFAGRLAEAIRVSESLLCLGLDPDGAVDAAAAERQCHALLEATLEHVCAVKPNLAFFEQYGSAGYALLERLREGDAALVYCSITGFGAGEGAALPGYDLLVQALGGLMSITGAQDGD